MPPLLPYGIPVPVVLPFLEKLFAAFLRRKKLMIFLSCITLLATLAGSYLIIRFSEMTPILYGPRGRSMKALVFYELGAYSRAAALYRSDYAGSLEADGTTSPVLVSMLRRDYSRAMNQAEQELHTDPESVDGLLALGQASYESGEYSRAFEYTRKVLAVYWDNTDALLLAGLITTRDPSQGDPMPFLNKALRTGRAARNLTSFINMLEITGHLQSIARTHRPYAVLAQYYRILRIYDERMARLAIWAARRAVEKNDRPSESYLTLGITYEKDGQYQEALKAYQESVKADPSQALAYFWASRLYAKGGNSAHEYLLKKKAVLAAPTDLFYISALYKFLLDRNESFAAKQLLEDVLRISPDNLTASGYLAATLWRMEERRAARDLAQRMGTFTSASPDDLEHKAWALTWMKKHDDAEVLLRRSVRMDKTRPDPHKELAKLYKMQNRLAEALKEFEIAYSMGAYSDRQEIWEYCELYEKNPGSGQYSPCGHDGNNRSRVPIQ